MYQGPSQFRYWCEKNIYPLNFPHVLSMKEYNVYILCVYIMWACDAFSKKFVGKEGLLPSPLTACNHVQNYFQHNYSVQGMTIITLHSLNLPTSSAPFFYTLPSLSPQVFYQDFQALLHRRDTHTRTCTSTHLSVQIHSGRSLACFTLLFNDVYFLGVRGKLWVL